MWNLIIPFSWWRSCMALTRVLHGQLVSCPPSKIKLTKGPHRFLPWFSENPSEMLCSGWAQRVNAVVMLACAHTHMHTHAHTCTCQQKCRNSCVKHAAFFQMLNFSCTCLGDCPSTWSEWGSLQSNDLRRGSARSLKRCCGFGGRALQKAERLRVRCGSSLSSLQGS